MKASDWTTQIADALRETWPTFPFAAKWIEAQVHAESGGDPKAISPVGAMGLLQLMPITAKEVWVIDVFSPEDNLRGGVEYLRRQFQQLGEVQDPLQRLFWSFASYNCGRGYIDFNGGPINTALELAKRDDPRGWENWDNGKKWLMHAEVAGKHPDYKQVWGYVDNIRMYYSQHTGMIF